MASCSGSSDVEEILKMVARDRRVSMCAFFISFNAWFFTGCNDWDKSRAAWRRTLECVHCGISVIIGYNEDVSPIVSHPDFGR